jgi:hypothetical protein
VNISLSDKRMQIKRDNEDCFAAIAGRKRYQCSLRIAL